jgi:phage terminase large subunit GpA-like protein
MSAKTTRKTSAQRRASLVGSTDGSACLFCANERQLKPGCTKQRWKVCKDHFMITCPKCGHEGFWMENMNSGSYFACFSLDCNWRSSTPPNGGDEQRAGSAAAPK